MKNDTIAAKKTKETNLEKNKGAYSARTQAVLKRLS